MNKLNQLDIEKILITLNEIKYRYPIIYEVIDLINQQNQPDPTFEEVIKEWEEKGFEIISCTRERFEIYKHWIERSNHCSHYTSAKVVIEKDYFYIVGQFPNEYRQLLIKTLKALGKEI